MNRDEQGREIRSVCSWCDDAAVAVPGRRPLWREALRDLVDIAVILGLMFACFVLLSAL